MFNLSDQSISYIIISPEKDTNSLSENKIACNKLCNILYSKDYTIIPVTGYYNGRYEQSFISINNTNNDSLRKDAINLMDDFKQESIIVKYKGEDSPKKILNDGSEKLLGIILYDSNQENKTYLYNGVSFSFLEQKRYYFFKQKEELRNGMIVEFFSNDRWVEKKIDNIDVEYEKMYKLLIKYNKLRACTG